MSIDLITIPIKYPLSLVYGLPGPEYQLPYQKKILYWRLICHTLNSFDLFYCNQYNPSLIPRSELQWFNLQTDFSSALWRSINGLVCYAGRNCYVELDDNNIYIAMNTW